MKNGQHTNCVRSVPSWSFSGPHFSRIRTKYGDLLRIQSDCGKMLEKCGPE